MRECIWLWLDNYLNGSMTKGGVEDDISHMYKYLGLYENILSCHISAAVAFLYIRFRTTVRAC